MKFDVTNTTISESNASDIEEVEMRFSEAALPHLTRMFVNLYNNPEEAVYREILFNAIDARNKAKSEENILVYLPTIETPVLTITDSGVGMSLEDLKRNSQFGGTDKNNENESVGGFGLGFKSPLAITAQFTVESIKNGERTVATISNSDDGICRMSVLLHEDTELPNSTTVSIPVKDHSVIRKIAQNYSVYVPDVITYINKEDYPYFTQQTHYTKSMKIFEGFYKTDRPWNSSYNMTIVMGGVPYKVEYSDLRFHIPALGEDFGFSSILEVPIGSITLSPNREGIQFNKKTKETIKNIFVERLEDFIEVETKKIESKGSFSEAYTAFSNSRLSLFVSSSDVTWNNIPISVSTIILDYKNFSGKLVPTSFTEVGSDTVNSGLKYIYPTSNSKLLLVEPSESINKSRSTYLIRQYFLKNDLDFTKYKVLRLLYTLDDYKVRDWEKQYRHGESKKTLVEALDTYKVDYEVLSLDDIKKDLEGWKNPNLKSSQDKPRVKYLEKVVQFLTKNSDGNLQLEEKTIEDIVGDGSKSLGLYEKNSSKDQFVNITLIDSDIFDNYVSEKYGAELEGVVFLTNNSKASVFEKNTKKFKNEYTVIEDFYSISEYETVNKIKDILESNFNIIDFISDYDYKVLFNNCMSDIKDDTLLEIFTHSGSRELDYEEVRLLRHTTLNNSTDVLDIVAKFLVDKANFTEEQANNYLESRRWYDITNVISSVFTDKIQSVMRDRYRLFNRSHLKESVEYMNMMFDSKYAS